MVDYKLITEIGIYASMFYLIGKTIINSSSSDFSLDNKSIGERGLESKILRDKTIDSNLLGFFHLSD